MSYTVFALKWRPKNFEEIIGQDRIVATLRNAIEKNRISHAYLFAGSRGVGKTSTARILARALNCKEGPTAQPCGTCSSCIEISQGRSLDVIEIDGASNRQIDDIRSLRENVKFSPVSGKFKVYIIDEVHQITSDGFNALLKTLEEPPPFVKFIFATTHPHKLPPTILSRCQRLDFRRISTMEIVGQLEKITRAEKIAIDPEVLSAIAKSSDGSLRDAESILDQLVSFSGGKVSLKDAITVLGIVEQDTLFGVTEKIIQKDAKGILEAFNHVVDEGKEISVFLSHLIEHFRNLMIAKVTRADRQLIDMPQEACDRLLKQSEAFSLEEIFGVFTTLVTTQEMSKRMESLRIPLEISLVKLTHDKKLSGVQAPSHFHQPRHSESAPPTPHAKSASVVLREDNPEPAPKNPAVSVSLEEVRGAWRRVIEDIAKTKMSVATYLGEGNLVKLENNVLTVSFPRNYSLHKESLEKKENKALIEKALLTLFNSEVKVCYFLTEKVMERKEEEHPFIKSALDTFNGRVIKES